MTAALDLAPADSLDPQALTRLWNAAYAGYFVPIDFTPEQLAQHVALSGIDLSRSLIGLARGEPYGLSLAAAEGAHAWIGGFGVVPAWRRRGLATFLIQHHVRALDAAGVEATRLEVIDVNPARDVYARAGFQVIRTLQAYEGDPGPGAGGLEEADPEAFGDLHARLNPERPVWRRTVARGLAALRSGTARLLVTPRGDAYALSASARGKRALLDAAAADAAAAERLFDGLGPGPLRLIDEPQGTPVRAAADRRLGPLLRQFEMERRP